MACFKQLGHFELLRERTLYHFSDNGRRVRMTFRGEGGVQRAEPVLAGATAGSSHGSPGESVNAVNAVNAATVAYLCPGSAELHPVRRDALLEAGRPHE